MAHLLTLLMVKFHVRAYTHKILFVHSIWVEAPCLRLGSAALQNEVWPVPHNEALHIEETTKPFRVVLYWIQS
jgi:hypothetical protein